MSKFEIGQHIESHGCGVAAVTDLFISGTSNRVAVEVERLNDGAKLILLEQELIADLV